LENQATRTKAKPSAWASGAIKLLSLSRSGKIRLSYSACNDFRAGPSSASPFTFSQCKDDFGIAPKTFICKCLAHRPSMHQLIRADIKRSFV
jgi:hypothetical protein